MQKYDIQGKKISNRLMTFFAEYPLFSYCYSVSQLQRWDSSDKNYRLNTAFVLNPER